MLYQVGPLTFDDYGLTADGVEREVEADFAEHALASGRVDFEFAGPGKDPLQIAGKIMPFHEGGLPELERAEDLCTSGRPQFVMRGDGTPLGWHVIKKVRAKHSEIAPTGVGYVIEHEMQLERGRDPGPGAGADLIGMLIGLFE